MFHQSFNFSVLLLHIYQPVRCFTEAKELSYEQIPKNMTQFTFQGIYSQESLWENFMFGTGESYKEVDS